MEWLEFARDFGAVGVILAVLIFGIWRVCASLFIVCFGTFDEKTETRKGGYVTELVEHFKTHIASVTESVAKTTACQEKQQEFQSEQLIIDERMTEALEHLKDKSDNSLHILAHIAEMIADVARVQGVNPDQLLDQIRRLCDK